MNPTNIAGVACELRPEEQRRQQKELQSGLLSAVLELRELPNGFALRFDYSPERVSKLGELLALESDCCPFLSHELNLAPNRGPVWLHISGPTEAKAFLRGELLSLIPAQLRAPLGEQRSQRRGTLAFGTGLSTVGVLALLCCVSPLLAVVGLGTAATFMGPYLDGIAFVALLSGAALLFFALRKRRIQDSCGGGC